MKEASFHVLASSALTMLPRSDIKPMKAAGQNLRLLRRSPRSMIACAKKICVPFKTAFSCVSLVAIFLSPSLPNRLSLSLSLSLGVLHCRTYHFFLISSSNSPQKPHQNPDSILAVTTQNFDIRSMDLRRQDVVEEERGGAEEEDQFDRIPDDLLLHILDRVHDARSLARCLAVSKRFSSLVPLTPTVSLSFPHPRPLRSSSSSESVRWRHRGGFFSRLLDKFVRSPIRFLHRVASPKSASCSGGEGDDDCDCDYDSRHTPGEVLKPFRGIESLSVELPSCVDAVGLNGKRTVLRWTAQFGGEMKSCVVLGANSLQRRDGNGAATAAASGEEGALESRPRAVGEVELEPGPVIAEEELKLRVVWIISCLIAASARHYLLKQIVADHPRLKSVAIVDSDKQGKVRLREEEIAEMRRSFDAEAADSAAAERIRVPDLRMKLWYVPELELPESGYVMRGATMVLIAPASNAGGEQQGKAKEGGGDMGDVMKGVSFEGGGGEEEAFREAAAEMRKMKKTYMLEMNSF
ncbi:hypothetical protein BT93_B3212 [Corymbia citriodora subsp. variegata]|nr:hypothetical protein BT93_B3212 [Corymbia citriodora subsp. variegata]